MNNNNSRPLTPKRSVDSMTPKKRSGRSHNNGTQCPHCKTVCKTVKTEQISETLRVITYTCPACGYTFEADLVAARSLQPSKAPNPNVHIPVSNYLATGAA
jgi:predicted Zn-ribbon and HTH transcriptional regulator